MTHLTQRNIYTAGRQRVDVVDATADDCATTAGLAPKAAMTDCLTCQELAEVDDVLLKRVAEIWRAQALRGDMRALGIANALEIELRRRLVPLRKA